MDVPQEFGVVDGACVAQHEWYSALRNAGFTRLEGLYIITRPSVELVRLQWETDHPGSLGQ